MGKVKSGKVKRAAGREEHAASLVEAIEPTSTRSRPSKAKRGHQMESILKSEKTTGRILSAARDQLDELEEKCLPSATSQELWPKLGDHSAGDDESSKAGFVDGSDMMKDLEIDESDLNSMQVFMNPNPSKQKTIADLIAEKLEEARSNVDQVNADLHVEESQLEPELAKSYEILAEFLTTYRSGKVPKLFKFVPRMKNFDEVLHILNPEEWTAAAMMQATKFFSSANRIRAQKFFCFVLLPRIRDDITHFKKLNPHLHQALKKSLFQPMAFCQGILLPLCTSDCTLREAIIISSILAKNSFPIDHAAAAILHISQLPFTNSNSIFLRTLICKKYALPFQALDSVHDHFMKFMTDRRDVPVLWHLCLKSFVELYSMNLSPDQRDALLELMKIHKHHQITPEIRKIVQTVNERDMSAVEMMPAEMV